MKTTKKLAKRYQVLVYDITEETWKIREESECLYEMLELGETLALAKSEQIQIIHRPRWGCNQILAYSNPQGRLIIL